MWPSFSKTTCFRLVFNPISSDSQSASDTLLGRGSFSYIDSAEMGQQRNLETSRNKTTLFSLSLSLLYYVQEQATPPPETGVSENCACLRACVVSSVVSSGI